MKGALNIETLTPLTLENFPSYTPAHKGSLLSLDTF